MRIKTALIGIALTATLAGCASTQPASEKSAETKADKVPVAQDGKPAKLTEARELHPRVVIAHDGGITTLDGENGKPIATSKLDGFLRLNSAGDGRHVMVSADEGFLVYDAGVYGMKHGDHYHYYTGKPALNGKEYKAPHPGHVVIHAGNTALFGDGDGSIQITPTKNIGDTTAAGKPILSFKTENPHHGVAVPLIDGSVFHTQGTEEERHTIQVVKDGTLLAQTDDCPGSHGEAAASPNENGDVIVMGCENGPVIYRDGSFHKVPVADAYSRSGNLAGHHDSEIVLGDYKVDPDAEPERPTRVALINSRTDELKLVELGSSYWFRSLARGPEGEGLVLTYDGNLQVLDVTTGEVTKKIPVISKWKEKKDWQQPGPILRVAGDYAYVTDANKSELVRVDLANGKVDGRYKLDFVPVEMAIATGLAEE